MNALIEAEFLYPGLPPRFVHPIVQQALQDSIPPARAGCGSTWPPPVRWRATRRGASAWPLTCWPTSPAGPVGERWAFDALTAAARRAANRGSPEQAVRFLRRALDEDAPTALRRSTLLDLGAAESAVRMPEAAGRMEEALSLSSDPDERARAALGLAMVRFLAAELPEAVAPARSIIASPERSPASNTVWLLRPGGLGGRPTRLVGDLQTRRPSAG